MKHLSIILVNYNVDRFLEQALKSVFKAIKNIDCEIFVVDNNSVDGSVEMLKSKFPEVILILNEQNVGFSKANNQAIRLSQGKYVLLLNPDTVIEETCLEQCFDFMEKHPDAGALGVKMLDGKGHFLPESKRGLPTPWVAFYKIFGFSKFFPNSKLFGRYHLGFLDKDKTHEVDILAGAFMFLRKETLDKIGLLDEIFFMYGEDIDLSYRIIKSGYKNYYYPDTRIIHYKGESTKKTTVNYVFIFYNAMIIFAQKHFHSSQANVFSFLIQTAIYLRAGYEIAKRFVKKLLLPVFDISISLCLLYVLHISYNVVFPVELTLKLKLLSAFYVSFWAFCAYYSGAYDKPFIIWKIFRGIFIGCFVISAFANFNDEFHDFRGLIMYGSIFSMLTMIFNRLVINFISRKKLFFGENTQKRLLIIGQESEAQRAQNLLNDAKINYKLIGLISQINTKQNNYYIAKLSQIKEMIEIFKVDEIIFCSKDISSSETIEIMSKIDNRLLEYKIFPDCSDFVIGSNSTDSQGDIYMVDVDFNITKAASIRNKKTIDLISSYLLLLIFPFVFFLYQNPIHLIKNIFLVLLGKYSWIGFSLKDEILLPKIKKGILSPISHLKANLLDINSIKRLDLQYARNYHFFTDIKIILYSFLKLDKK